MLEPKDQLDHIAEFADSGVRIFQRQGSLVGVPGSYGLKRWLTVGVAAGALSLAIFGLWNAPSVYVSGVTFTRVCAIALAVALTGGVLRVLRSAHPPAGATTIIVASGLLAKPHQMLDVLIGVLLLTIAGWLLNRAMGVPAPVWAARR